MISLKLACDLAWLTQQENRRSKKVVNEPSELKKKMGDEEEIVVEWMTL